MSVKYIIDEAAIIVRKNSNGGLQIFGRSIDEIAELITDDEEYLLMGKITFEPLHVFKEYKYDKGNTPDNLLSNNRKSALDHKNYKFKIL